MQKYIIFVRNVWFGQIFFEKGLNGLIIDYLKYRLSNHYQKSLKNL